jgi:(1->4)-alpha-D-glucan 1-alpha-D-glucosylmutase
MTPIEATEPPAVDSVQRAATSVRRTVSARIPLATYRLQLNHGFTFADAQRRVAYLRELGISDVYSSPYLKASAASTHGYDVADHNALNPAIGSDADYEAFVAELRRQGLGQVLDIVPNHMGIAEAANTWWMDVLENGPSSPYAGFFDITWNPLKSELRGKVLLPILGDQYGAVLDNGELVLKYRDGTFFVCYYDTMLPVAPETYSRLLQPCLGALAAELEPSDERVLELESILTSVGHLPRRNETAPERVAERQPSSSNGRRRSAPRSTRPSGSSTARPASRPASTCWMGCSTTRPTAWRSGEWRRRRSTIAASSTSTSWRRSESSGRRCSARPTA